MAKLTFTGGSERDIPDEAAIGDHGVSWIEKQGHDTVQHFVPWSAVLEIAKTLDDEVNVHVF